MTPHDFVAWCLHSPRRLAAVLVAVAAFGGVGLVLLPDDTQLAPASRQPSRAEAAPVARADPPAPSRVTSTHGEPRPAWSGVRRAAQAFLTAYLAPSEARARVSNHDDLKEWVTPTLWRGLRLTDPASLPTGVVASLEPVALGAFGAEVRAVLRGQSALELTLVEYDGGWRVADVQPGERKP